MLVRGLAGGPLGIAIIGAEVAAAMYLKSLQDSNAANAIKNTAHPLRRGNALFTPDGQEISQFPEDASASSQYNSREQIFS